MKKKQEEAHFYWKNRTNNSNRNMPYRYLKPIDRSIELYEFVNKHIHLDSKILEIGSNVGRNLNHFYQNGHKNVSGIEINEHAIEQGRESYSEMYMDKKTLFINDSAYSALKDFKKKYDLVFTMAVLLHMTTEEQNYVFNWIKNHTNVACFFEPRNPNVKPYEEPGLFWNVIPKYTILEKAGFKVIREEPCKKIPRCYIKTLLIKN
jgi:2-polyprenyl-3-methyl-5-hydroxy-6-metoxy-1,4-benzoquinol methylase